MLIEMWSHAFKEDNKQRPVIKFKKGLNVVLGKEDGAMSIGKSTSLLAIDFVFGGNTYTKSDGVKHEGNHTVYFAFQFEGEKYYFARSTEKSDLIFICNKDYEYTGEQYTKDEFVEWLKKQYKMDFEGLSFRTALSSYFRIYGKKNTDELNPPQGIPGQSMDKSITAIVKLFNRYLEIENFKANVAEQKSRLDAFKEARKYNFISDLVGGKTQYEANQLKIRDLELELDALKEEADKDHSEEDIERNKKKAELNNEKMALETAISAKERKLRLVNMSLEYGLYPTEADMASLQEFFPEVNLRKIYEIESYHQKLARILDAQFADERESIEGEIAVLKEQLAGIKSQIKELGFVGSISTEFLNRHSELVAEINALKEQNKAFLTLTELQEAKKNADEVLKRSIENILIDIETELNAKMRELNDQLFKVKKKPPYIHFRAYNSYKFETPDNTGTGSNYKGMIVYDLAVLFTTALPAIAHDSLLFSDLSKDAVDGIVNIYNSTDKQIFISYDKQGDCRPATKDILEKNCVLKLSDKGHELYGRSWDMEDEQDENEL